MLDWKQASPLARLIEFVKNNGNVKGPRIVYSNHGTNLTYDKIWFTGDFRVDKHRVAGRDWHVVVALFDPQKLKTGEALTNGAPLVIFDAVRRPMVGLEVSNRDGMERDITLLRMFGVEEIFTSM